MDEELRDIHFPAAGIDVSCPFSRQPNRPVYGGIYARTCVVGQNVRGYDAVNRVRGGSRPGLSKYVPVPVIAGWITQELAVIVTIDASHKV